MPYFEDEHIAQYSELGLAIPTRTIYIGSHTTVKDETDTTETGVDYKMAEKIIKAIHILDTIGTNEITFQLNNVGGDEYHGLAIYDAIRAAHSPTRIVVYGSAMSMASVILQAGKKRLLMPNATVMIHMGSTELSIDQRDINAYHAELTRINDVINNIYLERIREKNPRYSINQLKDLLSTDRFMSPQLAIETGLADEVIR